RAERDPGIFGATVTLASRSFAFPPRCSCCDAESGGTMERVGDLSSFLAFLRNGNRVMGQRRSIAGLRILITGASQGIGRALAVEAAKRGALVLAAARSEALLAELAQAARAAGGRIETVKADVTCAIDRQRMAEAARQHFGGLDVLVNNAGVGATGHFAEVGPERLRQIMGGNFFGLTETTRGCLPAL